MSLVELEQREHLAIVTLNRPERLNALDAEVLSLLKEAWTEVQTNDEIWIAILTARGRAFSAGADKSWFSKSLKDGGRHGNVAEAIAADPYMNRSLGKPVIAALNGFAVGLGLDMVLHSDFRVASEDAWLQQPEVGVGTIVFFNDQLPYAIEAEMAAGFRIPAQRAYEVGIYNRVVPAGQVMDTALEIAEQMLMKSPLALCSALNILKEIRKSAVSVPFQVVEAYATSYSKELKQTEDFQEAANALLHKTKPNFKKR